MKKAILTLALIMSIGATQVSLASSAPKHRYHPTTQQVDKQATPAAAKQEDKQATAGQTSAAQDDEAIAAYSDTTATDTTDYADVDDNENHSPEILLPENLSCKHLSISPFTQAMILNLGLAHLKSLSLFFTLNVLPILISLLKPSTAK